MQEAFFLTLKVASLSMLLVIPIGTYAAWRIAAMRRGFGRTIVEVMLSLPMVLPPTVVGFALLLLLGRGTGFGRWLNDSVGLRLVFTWPGAALASAVMAFPLFVRPVAAAFGSLDPDLLSAARVFGAHEGQILWRVQVPLSFRGITAGFALAFARAIGEFGATLMIAGSIPGETRTLSLSIYAAMESGFDREAWLAACLLVAITASLLVLVTAFERKHEA